MPTNRRKTAARREGTVDGRSALLVLVAALALSGLNLALMIGEAGALNGLNDSWQTLQSNYGTRMVARSEMRQDDAAAKAPEAQVVWSVVKFRPGEQERLLAALVQPIQMSFAPAGGLKVILIERKSPTSKDVNVRLFFADGTENSYLWPSTHADANGMWQP